MDDVRLYNADCLDILPTLGGVDAVVTDPPYGMDNNPDAYRFSGGQSPLITRIDNTPGPFSKPIVGDDRPFDPTPWLGFDRVVFWGFPALCVTSAGWQHPGLDQKGCAPVGYVSE